VLVIYVIPLTAAVAFLVYAGLWELAVALAVVEAVVVAVTVWASRTG
jgi:hypothetical protein